MLKRLIFFVGILFAGVILFLTGRFDLPKQALQTANLPHVSPQNSQPSSPSSALKTTPRPTLLSPPNQIHLAVSFTSQAPFAQWSDSRFQDGCEEAATIIAIHYLNNDSRPTIPPSEASSEILALSHFQQEKYGDYHDTSASDTVRRLFKDFYHVSTVEIKPVSTPSAIISELAQRHLVITPMNGRTLKNPFFTPPGPDRHMVVLIGYDLKTQEFITNDPGIRQGKSFRYSFDNFISSIRDYPTGDHLPIVPSSKVMIVLTRPQSS